MAVCALLSPSIKKRIWKFPLGRESRSNIGFASAGGGILYNANKVKKIAFLIDIDVVYFIYKKHRYFSY